MYELRPEMMETTAMTVITPMITPSSVRKLRSLCAESAPAAMRSVSMRIGCRLSVVGGNSRAQCFLALSATRTCSPHPILLLRHLLHLRSVLDLAQRAERAGHDLLAFLCAADELDGAVAGEAGLDRLEFHRAVLNDEDALLILGLARCASRFLA